jgi:hypothetical protein
MVDKPSKSAEEFLEQIKEAATALQAIYPDNRIQVQLHPTTYQFCRIELHVKNKKLFNDYEIFLNPFLKGRYAIAVLEEIEPGWSKPRGNYLTEEDDDYFGGKEIVQPIYPSRMIEPSFDERDIDDFADYIDYGK